MSKWVWKGLQTGVVTSGYPEQTEKASGISPGFPSPEQDAPEAEDAESVCPAQAFHREKDRLLFDRSRCLHCFRCVRNESAQVAWEPGFEWAEIADSVKQPARAFRHSLHIRVIDAGDCGACLNEVHALNNPFYNMHRLGFFITPSPRQADVLLVVGPVTDHMKVPLQKAYAAMPEPKWVVAAGVCALSGGVFGGGVFSGSGVESVIPVDLRIPGCPPPPLAIIHGLLALCGRKTAPVFAKKPAEHEQKGTAE